MLNLSNLIELDKNCGSTQVQIVDSFDMINYIKEQIVDSFYMINDIIQTVFGTKMACLAYKGQAHF